MKPVIYRWRAAIRESDLTPTARHIALTISTYMTKDGDGAWPSMATLASDTGRSRDTVKRAIRELAEAGFLEVESGGGRRADGGYVSNRYVATAPLQPDNPVADATPEDEDGGLPPADDPFIDDPVADATPEPDEPASNDAPQHEDELLADDDDPIWDEPASNDAPGDPGSGGTHDPPPASNGGTHARASHDGGGASHDGGGASQGVRGGTHAPRTTKNYQASTKQHSAPTERAPGGAEESFSSSEEDEGQDRDYELGRSFRDHVAAGKISRDDVARIIEEHKGDRVAFLRGFREEVAHAS